MTAVHPPCPKCGRSVFPIGDREGSELCLKGDLESAALAAQRALEDVPSGHPAWAYIQNILDIAERHAAAKA